MAVTTSGISCASSSDDSMLASSGVSGGAATAGHACQSCLGGDSGQSTGTAGAAGSAAGQGGKAEPGGGGGSAGGGSAGGGGGAGGGARAGIGGAPGGGGSSDKAGAPNAATTLVTGPPGAQGVSITSFVLDGTDVYFSYVPLTASDPLKAGIYRLAGGFGPPIALTNDPLLAARVVALAADTDSVYWAQAGYDTDGSYALVGVLPKAGGPGVALAGGSSPDTDVQGVRQLQVDDSSVYWLHSLNQMGAPPTTEVRRLPKTGGSASELEVSTADGPPQPFAQMQSFAVLGGQILASWGIDHSLYGTPSAVDPKVSSPAARLGETMFGFAADGGSVYTFDVKTSKETSADLISYPRAGGGPAVALGVSVDLAQPQGTGAVALVGSTVLTLCGAAGETFLVGTPTQGGTGRVFVGDAGSGWSLQANPTTAYWLSDSPSERRLVRYDGLDTATQLSPWPVAGAGGSSGNAGAGGGPSVSPDDPSSGLGLSDFRVDGADVYTAWGAVFPPPIAGTPGVYKLADGVGPYVPVSTGTQLSEDVTALAVDAGSLYWAAEWTLYGFAGAGLVTLPKAGGTPSVLASFTGAASHVLQGVSELVVENGTLLFTNQYTDPTGALANGINAMATAGGDVSVLVAPSAPVTCDGPFVPSNLQTDGSGHLYFEACGVVYSTLEVAGAGAMTQLTPASPTTVNGGYALSVDSVLAFGQPTSMGSSAVALLRYPKAGGTTGTPVTGVTLPTASDVVDGPRSVALFGGDVYWLDEDSSITPGAVQLYRAPLFAGGAMSLMSLGGEGDWQLEIGASAAYFLSLTTAGARLGRVPF